MSRFIKATWQWRLSIVKCSLYVFIGMGTIWCATVQSWDPDFVAGLKWYNWSFIAVSMLVGACKDIITFIDKTHATESDKINNSSGGGTPSA